MKLASKKFIACTLALLMMLTMIIPAAMADYEQLADYEIQQPDDVVAQTEDADPDEETTPAAPRAEWTEDFEGNDISGLRWFQNESIPGNRIGQNLIQAIVEHNASLANPPGTSPGENSDPDSVRIGRYSMNHANLRTNRLVFKEPITRAGTVSFTFDWFPGTPTFAGAFATSPYRLNSYGSLNFNNVYHFNSYNWLRLITTGAEAGITPGIYFYTGVQPNNTPLDQLGLTEDNLITTNRDVWYRVSVDFDFNVKTIDLAFVDAVDGTPVWSREDIPIADEDYLWGQIIALQFIGNRIVPTPAVAGNMAWSSFMDNVNVRVYGHYLSPFGMPQNILYSPVTYDSVTLSWDGMEADEFRIYRRHGTDAASRMAVVATVPGDTFTYTDSGLTGPYYWYAVSAVKDGAQSPRTRDAFIQLAFPSDAEYTIISEFDTGDIAGFSNRLRIGDLDGDGRNDILLVNTLPQSGRSWEGFGGANWNPANNTMGATTIFTEQDGVWTPQTATAPTSSTGDGTAARVIFSLTAVDIEGNVIWQRCAATGMRSFDGFSREVSTAACEPVQIKDVTGDGYNNVIVVANPGVLVANAPAWTPSQLSIDRGLLDHPDYIWNPAPQNYQNRFYQIANDVFYILDGRTGDIARDVNGREMFVSFAELAARPGVAEAGITLAIMNTLNDTVALADLDGRGITQHVILSNRYTNPTAWEMINEDGEFVMNFLWRFVNPPAPTGGDAIGHFPLSFPVFAGEGDNRDWVFGTQRLHHPETGEAVWSAPFPIPSRNPQTTEGGLGSARNPSGHTDSIQIGDFRGDGELYVQFGVDGMLSGQLFNAQTGRFVWTFDHATELQYQNMGWFRTDADGMFTYGLERRNRGAWPIGHSGTFMIDDRGQPVYMSENNYQAWTATASLAPNITGTFSPLGLNHNRNIEAILSGNPAAVSPENFVPSILIDGYMNVIASISDISTMSTTRAMTADFVGDSREEIVLYNEFGQIRIVAIGTEYQDIRSGVTGNPRQQTRNLGNWTRYNVAEIVTYFSHKTAPSPIVNMTGTTAEVTLIPIIFAESYDLYHNGVHIKTFDPLVDDLRFTVTGLSAGEHEFAFTASRFDHFRGRIGTTAQSMPSEVSVTPREVLETLVAYAELVERDDHTAVNWTRLMSTLTAANRVLANASATDAQILAAIRNLESMLDNLR